MAYRNNSKLISTECTDFPDTSSRYALSERLLVIARY